MTGRAEPLRPHLRYRVGIRRPRPGEVLIADAFHGHSEVVEAVAEQLDAAGVRWSAVLERHHRRRLTWDPRVLRDLKRGGRLRFARSRSVTRFVRRAAAGDVPLIVTSEYAGGQHVVPSELLGRAGVLVLVHNAARFEREHEPLRVQPSGVVPALVRDDRPDRPQVRLVARPRSRVAPSRSDGALRLVIVGHSGRDAGYWDRVRGLAEAVARRDGVRLTLIGRSPARVLRTLEGLRGVRVLSAGGSTDGPALRRWIAAADALVSLKSPGVFGTRWSGTAGLALTHGVCLVAPDPLIALWGLSEAGCIPDDGLDPDHLLTLLEREGHAGLAARGERIASLGRRWFEDSARDLAAHVLRAGSESGGRP